MIGLKGFTSQKSFCRSGLQTLSFGGREATTGNASAVRRLLILLLLLIFFFLVGGRRGAENSIIYP